MISVPSMLGEPSKKLFTSLEEAQNDPGVNRILQEAQRQKFYDKIDSVLAMSEVPQYTKDYLLSLREEIASSDWSKIGAILGLLWYKLDRVIGLREQEIETLKAIQRNTERSR